MYHVELKSRNIPTLSRSKCAKRFWSKLRHVLPDAIVKKLSYTLNQRRVMREQCLQEALASLWGDDEALLNKMNQDVDESYKDRQMHETSCRGQKDGRVQRAFWYWLENGSCCTYQETEPVEAITEEKEFKGQSQQLSTRMM
jgi:hypothetical protein